MDSLAGCFPATFCIFWMFCCNVLSIIECFTVCLRSRKHPPQHPAEVLLVVLAENIAGCFGRNFFWLFSGCFLVVFRLFSGGKSPVNFICKNPVENPSALKSSNLFHPFFSVLKELLKTSTE